MSNDDGLPPKVGDCQACLLRVLAISEYNFDLLCDRTILVQSSIDVMDGYWVRQGMGLQLVLLDKDPVDKHSGRS